MKRWVSSIKDFDRLPDGVAAERSRQVSKWGIQHHSPERWLTILTEEVGEWAKAFLDMDGSKDSYTHMRDELVQVAAVALSALADLDGRAVDARQTTMEWPALPDDFDPARPWAA